MNTFYKKRGYIAISTMLIISVIVLTISISITMLSIDSAQSSLAIMKGEDTLSFVEGCAEDGLLKSQASIDYAGGAITRPEGTCQIALSKNGTLWTMTVSTLDTKYIKTVMVTFSRTPTEVTLLSEKEI